LTSDIVHQVLQRLDREAGQAVRVSFAGQSFLFGTNAPHHVAWLRSYTAPQYDVDAADAASRAHLTSFEDTAFEAGIRQRLGDLPGRSTVLYQDYPAFEVDLGDGWTAWAHTSRPSIIVCSPDRRRCVTLGVPGDVESKAEPVRCLREMFTKTIERTGHLVFHAGAVAIEGHGVAICGAKGAGKSTTVISLVEAGASFLSNDRSYIGPDDDDLRLYPWPTTSAIGMGTLYHFPGLRSWLERGGGWTYEPQGRLTEAARHEYLATLTPAQLAALPDKLELTSEELARSLGSTVHPSAPLAGLVFPQLDLDRRDVVIEEAPAGVAAEVLRSQCYTPRDKSYPDWLRWRTEAEDRLAAASRALIDRLVKE
jgi:hypothetical protein